MAGLTLHNWELDEDCYRVRLLLACLGIKAVLQPVDVFPGRDHLKPAFRQLSPLGRLPVLIDGDIVLDDAIAILAHLARTRDDTGRFLPADPAGFAATMRWLAFAARDLPVTARARRQALFGEPGDVERTRIEARAMLRVVDDHVTHRLIEGADFIAASHPTIADVAIFPAFALSRDWGQDHDEFAGLRRWARRLRNLPGFVTMPGIPEYH